MKFLHFFKKKTFILPVISILFAIFGNCYAADTAIPIPSASAAAPVANFAPAAPDFDVKAFILIDANSGAIIAAKNPDEHLPPASITKLMSLYLIASSLKNGHLHLDDQVVISENAWRMDGSRMFAKVGSTISAQELINGIIVASGNDATVAMAEHIAGTEQGFVNLMNQTAASLGLKDTHYEDSNGLPANNHYSSARDIAALARTWIATFPEYYPWFKQQWIVYNKIKQPNRNRLLWRDPTVDGMKTGHTEDAGYCLVASAVRNGTRLISVVLGTPSDAARTNDSEALLNYGFRFFETHKVFAANTRLTTSKIWLGKENKVDLGLKDNLYVTIPSGQYQNLKASVTLDKVIKAPLVQGQPCCGTVNISLDGKLLSTQPLVSLKDVPNAGSFSSLIDKMQLLFVN